jgi:hypothetical protein
VCLRRLGLKEAEVCREWRFVFLVDKRHGGRQHGWCGDGDFRLPGGD